MIIYKENSKISTIHSRKKYKEGPCTKMARNKSEILFEQSVLILGKRIGVKRSVIDYVEVFCWLFYPRMPVIFGTQLPD